MVMEITNDNIKQLFLLHRDMRELVNIMRDNIEDQDFGTLFGHIIDMEEYLKNMRKEIDIK